MTLFVPLSLKVTPALSLPSLDFCLSLSGRWKVLIGLLLPVPLPQGLCTAAPAKVGLVSSLVSSGRPAHVSLPYSETDTLHPLDLQVA